MVVTASQTKYKKIWTQLKNYLPSMLQYSEAIGEYKAKRLKDIDAPRTDKGSPAGRLYIIEFYERHRAEMPEGAHGEMEKYKAMHD